MKYFSVKFSLVVFTVAFTAQYCLGIALVRKGKTPAKNTDDALPKVTCSSQRIGAVFGPLVQDNLQVKDWSGAKVPVPEAKEQCGVRKVRDNGNIIFLSRYDSCYTKIEGAAVVVSLAVQLTGEDQWFRVNISCPRIKTHSQRPSILGPKPPPGMCDTDRALRVDCGPQDVSRDDCSELGCCYDSQEPTCYYPLNDCSLDGHFVFSVRTTDTEPPLTPSRLTVRDQPHCSPVITTTDTAVFKIGVMECGAKMKVDGDLMIFEVEVEELHTNTVTKHSPFRYNIIICLQSTQVQCEYEASDLQRAADLQSLYGSDLDRSKDLRSLYASDQERAKDLRSLYASDLDRAKDRQSLYASDLDRAKDSQSLYASDLDRAKDLQSRYAVTNPPPVTALGTVTVQMRIAEDASFTSFYTTDQLPVTFPLRETVYVEVSIAEPFPDPSLSLRVRDCFAYPASRHSVWTLLYDGCPNPLDDMRSSVPKDHQGETTSHSLVRRFDVKTFTFLDPQTGYPSVEEMFFYCWVEICTEVTECAQPCSIISSEGDRQRREAAVSGSSLVQLVSLGPLLMGQNGTEVEETPCEQQRTVFQVSLYTLATVSAALLFILLLMMMMRRRQYQQAPEEACDTPLNTGQCQ